MFDLNESKITAPTKDDDDEHHNSANKWEMRDLWYKIWTRDPERRFASNDREETSLGQKDWLQQ